MGFRKNKEVDETQVINKMRMEEREEKKTMKMHTKLAIMSIVLGVLFIVEEVIMLMCTKMIIQIDEAKKMAVYQQMVGFSFVLLVIFIVVGAATAVPILKRLRHSLKNVNEVTDALAVGNTEVELAKTKKDEIGILIEKLEKVIQNTKYQESCLRQIADGDLTIKVNPASNEDTLGNALRDLVERNLEAMININEAADQVMTTASQIASASESLAQGSTEQASAIEEITASITDVAAKTKENASQATTASEIISKAITDVKSGNEEMREMLSAMDDINKSSESISKIIKVIDDIAFQTNILALNAAVEAARAGEAGKGFAVVAEEVRNLAAKSANAAAETAELIEDSIKKVGVGSNIANKTSEALEEITKAVEESDIIVKGIANASNYQATAVAQIDQAIGQVSEVVQTNSATSEQCAAASEELARQAQTMEELISVYNLGEGKRIIEPVINTKPLIIDEAADNEQIISLGEGFGKY